MSRDRSSPEGSTGKDRFTDAAIDRRTFVKLSAATGAALALPGNASADASVGAFEADYQYVQNHTPTDHAVPTLVEFEDGADPSVLEAFDTNAISTTEPRSAAYGRLTAAEADAAATELPAASNFQFAPGSNPFWRIGYYPFGVFPEARRSVDFVGFEQLKDGLRELEDRYPDTINVERFGESPGHRNNATQRDDPKGMYLAEVTDFTSDASFEEKEKVFFSCSLHGLERAGAEAGARIIENIARGDQYAGDLPDLLADAVLIFGFTNPDGWAVRNPQYDSGWQVGGPGTGTPRAPAAPLFERGNAEIYDTNRQYPTVGYITTAHNPAEPRDAPDYIDRKVPDAVAVVEQFRSYENLNYGADLHGGPLFEDFVLGLISQDQYTLEEAHEVYAMCEVIKENLDEALVEWQTAGDLSAPLRNALGNPSVPLAGGTPPDDAFDYATIYDTIGYTVSGAMLDWMAHPEDLGGLGMTTLDFEMSFSHMAGGNVYNPELLRMEVLGYREAIRTISEFAVRNSDTPTTDDEFDTVVETTVETSSDGGESVAFVTPTEVTVEREADADRYEPGDVVAPDDPLTRSNDDLAFASSTGEVDTFSASGTIGPGVGEGVAPTRVEEPFDTADLDGDPFALDAELSWTPPGEDLEFFLEDPDGKQVGSAVTASNPETMSNVPLEADGTYTFVVETYANVAAQYEISASFIGQTDGSGTETDETSESTTVPGVSVPGTSVATVSQEVPAGLHSMQVHTHSQSGIMDLELVSPSGDVVREFEGITEKRIGGKCCGFPEWDVAEPEPGEWTVRMTNLLAETKGVEVQFATLSSNSTNPDPKGALGYEQRDYEVTPLQFAADYDAAVGDAGAVDLVSVDAVATEDALSGYDHAVVIHDYIDAANRVGDGAVDTEYFDALDAFVDDGNNLVLTDTGVTLLGVLENGLVGDGQFGADAFTTTTQDVARYTSKNLDHPLMTDVRPIQNQLWKVAPLGYNVSGQAPSHLVSQGAFTGGPATSSVAGTIDGAVATGSLTRGPDDGTGVHVIGSLLPPASQANLHPFGLLDYTVSFLGYLVFTSALGFQQVRTVEGEAFRFGRGDSWSTGGGSGGSGGSGGGPGAAGSRGDTNSPYTPGATHQVELTITELSETATVTDSLPSSDWGVVGGGGTQNGAEVDLGEVGAVDASDDPVTLNYFVEVPETNGQATFGPAAASTSGGTTAFGGTNTVTVVGGTGAPASSGTDTSLTDDHGFTADTL
ncbi:M14 family metallopeptidase [Haloglomus litoreum]|uniref:M14 family metallopeptidase n=1 Tax=Haloglomus litoreum TaxID=3034026 RepID=UPI0023E762E4|nr:M14 family metallopeptidase [Haloglomus sp. DT116]